MLKDCILIEHNNKYLLTSSSYERTFDHDRYVGSSPTFQFKTRKLRQIVKGLQIWEAHECKRHGKRPKRQCQQKYEETKSIPKQMMSENEVAGDNFDKVELHVHSYD